jgi:hypothetical protein
MNPVCIKVRIMISKMRNYKLLTDYAKETAEGQATAKGTDPSANGGSVMAVSSNLKGFNMIGQHFPKCHFVYHNSHMIQPGMETQTRPEVYLHAGPLEKWRSTDPRQEFRLSAGFRMGYNWLRMNISRAYLL